VTPVHVTNDHANCPFIATSLRYEVEHKRANNRAREDANRAQDREPLEAPTRRPRGVNVKRLRVGRDMCLELFMSYSFSAKCADIMIAGRSKRNGLPPSLLISRKSSTAFRDTGSSPEMAQKVNGESRKISDISFKAISVREIVMVSNVR